VSIEQELLEPMENRIDTSRGPGSIPGTTRFFREVVGLERGPYSLVSTTEELLGRKSNGSGLEIRDYGHRGSTALTTRHVSIHKSWHKDSQQAAVPRSA
jgi:hypothetical protein